MDTVTHLAGPAVRINDRIIQRCLICGQKLADNINTAGPLNEDGTQPEFPTWDAGAIVETDGHRMHMVGKFTECDMPANNCLVLVEE